MDISAATASFMCGVATGVLLIGIIMIYLLSGSPNGNTPTIPAPETLRELPPKEEERKLLEDALAAMRAQAAPKPSSQGGGADESSRFAAEESPSLHPLDMEIDFNALSNDAIERQKQNKGLCSIINDFAKLHASVSRELIRLSQIAESHVRADNQRPIDKFWNSFSIALDHWAQDVEAVAAALAPGLVADLSRLEQEHVIKKLHSDGSKYISKMKEASATFDARSKEMQKLKEKAAVSAASGMSVGEHSRLLMKKDICETALKSAREQLQSVQEEMRAKMPSIISDYKLIASSASDATLCILVKVTDVLVSAQLKSSHILNRLKIDVASTTARSIDKNSTNPFVLDILEQLGEGGSGVVFDMGSEAVAAVASSLLPMHCSLPPQFGRCVGVETCVWLNAFSGRMYRDAARSDYFHNWFCVKAAALLNKGKRPGFVDVYEVSDVVFGANPPSIRNLQWLPHCPLLSGQKHDPDHNVACTADVCFRSGISFTVSTKLWINWPRDRYAFIPVKMRIELVELSGKVHFGVQKRASFFSFIDEPYTRFSVKSEVGGEYKLKDLPRISTLIIAKLKKYIRTKVCFPKAHKFRLMWPKKWWPEGPDEYKDGSAPSSGPAGSAETVTGRVDKDLSESLPSGATSTEALLDNSRQDALPKPSKPSSNAAVLLTSTGTAMRENLSKWLVKPLIQGKEAAVAASAARKQRRLDRLSQAAAGGLVGSDDDSSADEYLPPSKFSGRYLVLEPYRSSLLSTETIWDDCIRRAFLHEQGEGLLMEASPGIAATIEMSRVRLGFGHAASSKNLQTERAVSRDGGPRLDMARMLRANSIDLVDIPSSSSRSKADMRAVSAAKTEMKPRSHTMTDFRSSSLELTAFVYFNQGGPNRVREMLHIAKDAEAAAVYANRINVIGGGAPDRTPEKIRHQNLFSRVGSARLDQLSASLMKRLSSAGSSLQVRRHELKLQQPRESPRKAQGGLSSAVGQGQGEVASEPASRRFRNDGFVFNTSPRVEDDDAAGMAIPPVDPRLSKELMSDSAAGKGKMTNFFGISRQLEKAKDVLKSSLMRPGNAPKKEDYTSRILVDSKEEITSISTKDESDKDVGPAVHITLPSSSEGVSAKALETGLSPTSLSDPEKEAELLAWQARAQAISEATSSGELPSMQGFLFMKQQLPSCKKWVVLRQGNIGVFNNPSENTMFGVPLTHVNLKGAICRPSSTACCFEVGIPLEVIPGDTVVRATSPTGVSYHWMPFFTHTEVQCRAWIMAIQQSSHELK